ncbi:hypothetical protein [Barnesiella sp. An55]|uniref:hypothetical protein n=1 Tax=Barnesiella sp. An55 TaxID=1965646 RepID=UPI000B38D6B6|nr:hypothetical protein [Barnesiella sp. An55]OUN70874.1 hypothetical protein B5G10_10105 [Barnesiella sp. An55]
MKFNYQTDVWSLLRQNISKGQLIGYAIANIVGISVILIGILFYNDSQHGNSQEDQYFTNDFVVLSKKVEGVGFSPISFSEEEIAELQQEKWVKKIGRFTSSQFAVSGSVTMGGKSLSSYLFFESVPDEFFDVKPKDWDFSPEKKFVPIVLCKDYLMLYNFGFAIPQGLPQLSEEIIGAVPITLRLTGEDMMPEYFEASIVGFSSRLNTIAVPQSFMDWANQHYSKGESTPNTSRLIVLVDRLASSQMDQYLKEHDIEMAGDQSKTGNISHFLGIVSAVVTTNGVVICILAMFILVLSIFLLLQKSREKLRNLMLLGYHPQYVSRYYETVVLVANVVITGLSLGITFLARTFWSKELLNIGLGNASPVSTLLFALFYLVVITALDLFIIRTRLLRIWRNA